MYKIGGLESTLVRRRRSLTNSLPTNSTFQIFCDCAFVDDEHDAVVGRLVAFENADLGVVETVAMIEVDELSLGFLHGVGIDRAADFEIGFFGELTGADSVVAEVLDVAHDGPLDDFENDDAAIAGLLVGGLHVDKPAAGGELANIALDECRVEGPADARLQLVEDLRRRNRGVADDADIGDGLIGGGKRGAGDFAVVFLLAENRIGRGGNIAHAAATWLSEQRAMRYCSRNGERSCQE